MRWLRFGVVVVVVIIVGFLSFAITKIRLFFDFCKFFCVFMSMFFARSSMFFARSSIDFRGFCVWFLAIFLYCAPVVGLRPPMLANSQVTQKKGLK